MNQFRKLLFPFGVLYDGITRTRNFLFDKKILKSYSFNIPIICVGNLNVGGTGKTPQIEYLIRLLSDNYRVATLSRGYKRQSKGFVLANETSNAATLGDEPFQFYSKFKNIQVAVDSDRKNGIENLLSHDLKPEIILLDDAFQHRKVKAGFYILLSTFDDLYSDDLVLPAGNLRESRSNANRADIIIVTKCPKNLSIENQNIIIDKLKINKNQQIFFSCIAYDDKIYSESKTLLVTEIKNKNKLLIAGIANPKPFFEYLKSPNDIVLEFSDHHYFTKNEIENIKQQSADRIIITTEKDYVRFKNESIDNLFYLPIKSNFIGNAANFDSAIIKFVTEHILQ